MIYITFGEMTECHCRPVLELLGVLNQQCDFEGLSFALTGLNLCENEGTNKRTATGHWRCLQMKNPLKYSLTDTEDINI